MNRQLHLVFPRARIAHVLIFLALAPVLFCQQPAGAGTAPSSLPDAPQPQQQGTSSSTKEKDSSFIGYATSGSFVFPDIATAPGPLSPKGKFKLFVNESISPAYVLVAATGAAFHQAANTPPGYGQGWDAYASRFGANMGRASSISFFGSFLFPSLLHQDPRFFPQSKPTFWGSVKYSARRVVITQTDSGRETFNASGIFGALSAETLANTYLPVEEQTGAKTAVRSAADLAWNFGGNMLRNYWPTFFRTMGLEQLKVIPHPRQP